MRIKTPLKTLESKARLQIMGFSALIKGIYVCLGCGSIAKNACMGTCCRHKFFNTNNLWVNLDKLKATLETNNGVMKLPLIKNKKTVNPL